jgi:penicillin amidase
MTSNRFHLVRRAATACVALAFVAMPAKAIPPTAWDNVRAVNVVAPGESRNIDLPTFLQQTAAGTSNYGPHYADQLGLYASFQYKSMQFEVPPFDASPIANGIVRDSYGVPVIHASDRASLYRLFGYAMAQDRMFQMDLFRRAGHGTLAEILGEAYIPMDTEVRTVSEGPAARAAELANADQQTKDDLASFSDGVNQYIDEVTLNPLAIPAEFTLLGDLPIAHWTPDDTLAFGEYAGRFFGEWGHAEIEMAHQLSELTAQFGAEQGQKIFDDLYPLDDPGAPVTVPASVGTFPRHTAPALQSEGAVNRDARTLRAADNAAAAMQRIERTTYALRRNLGLKGFGSNQYVVDGAHTADGHPLLVSEPQTGWAVPSFFWEVELHGGGFDVRGVTVPGLNLIVIGRNSDSAWAVTSALDANSDTFAEYISSDGKSYLYDGEFLPLQDTTETLICRTPPTALLALPGTSGVCSAPVRQIVVSRTVHGPLLLPADKRNHIGFSRQSVVDGRIVESLKAWTDESLAHSAKDFYDSASRIAFGFNFMYADAAGEAGYWHIGRYPIRRADVDERLPLPGTGDYDWQGFEDWNDQPHALDVGALANWNNKPAVGWYSKGLLGFTSPEHTVNISTWGPAHQVEPIQADLVAIGSGITFDGMAKIERHVAAVDNRARAFKPYLLAAIDASGDPALADARAALAEWDGLRADDDGDGSYDAPGLALFDRWMDDVLVRTFLDGAQLPADVFDAASGLGPDHDLRSADNGDAPSFKFENALFGTLLNSLRGNTNVAYPDGDEQLLASLRHVLPEWSPNTREFDETAHFAPQGAGSVPDIAPLPDRGSYGQIVEPGAPR